MKQKITKIRKISVIVCHRFFFLHFLPYYPQVFCRILFFFWNFIEYVWSIERYEFLIFCTFNFLKKK